ncbi:hypothetical protein GGI20_003603 [Coemansia sp. BCRC 34301]|nr:hypothetical protein GGI20_003603 [Coemansia sp. BCRC 34301]
MAFGKGLWQMFLIFTVVFWISICFLFGAGYDGTRHMKDARMIFRDFDLSPASTALAQMINGAFAVHTAPNLVDFTQSAEYASPAAVREAVWNGDAWAAVTINQGFGERLAAALAAGSSGATAYDPGSAVTLVTEESRHYFKVQVVVKTAEGILAALQAPFAQAMLEQEAGGNNAQLVSLIQSADPLALVAPFGFTVDNVAPFHFDLSLYVLSVTLSLCMVAGSFIPSNMWKTIETPFYQNVRVAQVIGLRLFINMVWAIVICLQATGIVFAFRGPSWSPTAGDFFGIFGIILLNTLAFSFFIDCMQNWLHPRFLLATYFTMLFVNISGAVFGTEINNHFFRILYATPFLNSGLTLRTLLTRGSYNKTRFSVTINVAWSLVWWVVSTFLIARKARLVRAGKMLMANVPPPPSVPSPAPVSEKASVQSQHMPSGSQRSGTSDETLLGTGALRMAAGVAIPSLEKRIVGGFLMPGVLAPYSVSLVKADGDKQYTCGGTIISNNFILTAAHCVISKANVIIPAANITMGYGNVDRNAQKKVKATGVFIHPQYISGSERDVRYDIALVEVKKLKFNKNTGSIPIYKGTIIAGQKLMAMGWGAAEDGATKLNMMRGTIVTTGDTESCQTYYRNFDDNNGPQLCTLGKLNPGSSTCTGDSGSSVVASRKDVVMLAGFDSIGVFTVGSNFDSIRIPGAA